MGKRKEYAAEALVAASRWQEAFAGFPPAQQQAVIARVDELVAENPEYCDEGNYGYLCNLFTGLAVYEWHVAQGVPEEEAYRLTAQPSWAAVEKTAEMYRRLFKVPGMFRLFGMLAPKLLGGSGGYGWRYQFHPSTKTRIQGECLQCIYADILGKYGCREVGCMFCHADEINFGHIPGVTFTREHTLCSDSQPCDFLFTRD